MAQKHLKDTSVLIEKYINTSYDIVKAVYDNLASIIAIASLDNFNILVAIEEAFLTVDKAKLDAIVSGTQENTLGAIQFDVNYADGQSEGKLQWNLEDGTLEVGMPGGIVNMQIGQETIVRVRNITGTTIPNGAALYITGAQANRATVGLAQADDIPQTLVAGLATEDIPHNNNGYMTIVGLVRDINTLGLVEGQLFYLSETVPGGYQQDRPISGPNYAVNLGVVIRAHATEGVVLHQVTIVPRLDRASGVELGTPIDGQMLAYNEASEHYELIDPPSAISVGQGINYYLGDNIVTGDNLDLVPTSPGTAEVEVQTIGKAGDTPKFIERFVTSGFNNTTIGAGVWIFHTYAKVDAPIGNTVITIRLNRSIIKTGTLTVTGTGLQRTFTATEAGTFVAGDANADILLATLIETPTETFWIDGFVSDTEVTASTDQAGYTNESGIAFHMYYLLFSVETSEINATDPTLYINETVQPEFALDASDEILLAYFMTTTSSPNRILSLYKNGTENYSHLETPIIIQHNDLVGLNVGDFLHLTATEKTKFDGIEDDATADQTAGEIEAIISHDNLQNIPGNDHIDWTADQGATNIHAGNYINTTYSVGDGGLTEINFTSDDNSKLDGIEDNATNDQTDAEIRAAVEAATDSNVFNDIDHSKLNAIEASATADQSNAEIKTAYEANANTNEFSDSEQTKLAGIETVADVTDGTNVAAAGAVMEADNTTVSMSFVIDEDTMVSNLATKIPTQQSVKAYVDAAVASSVVYQGGYNAATNTPNLDTAPTGIEIGYMYTVTAAGTFYTAELEIGDVLISEAVNPTTEAQWTIVNKDLNAASIKASYESNADTNEFSDAEQTKLAGIETAATADQTNAEIRTAVEAATDSNVFNDADHSKLNAIEAGAKADQTAGEIEAIVNHDNLIDFVGAEHIRWDLTGAENIHADRYTNTTYSVGNGGLTEINFTSTRSAKLDGIETSATADQTNAEIRTAIEAATDSNVFNNADHSKLNAIEAAADVTDTANVTAAGALMDSELAGIAAVKAMTAAFMTADETKLDAIESGATADQTNTQIRDAVEAASNSNTFNDTDHSKLNGIESGATADQTKTDIDALGINATQLDGITGPNYARTDMYETFTDALQILGTLEASTIIASGDVTAYSDKRLKENLEIIPNALDKIEHLNGYTFSRIDTEKENKNKRQTGVIAQEVLKVLPEAVTEGENGMLAVSYGNMVGLLIEAIKELKQDIQELKNEL